MTFSFKNEIIQESLLFSNSTYFFEENSFINYEPNDVSLMINQQYLSLDVNLKNNAITGISGYFNFLKCAKKKLHFLKGKTGRIKVLSDPFTLECGIGYNYPIEGEAFFDEEKMILQIGKVKNDQVNIQISENIILCVLKEKIMCIQIKMSNIPLLYERLD